MLKFDNNALATEMVRKGITTAILSKRMGWRKKRGARLLDPCPTFGLRTIGRIADALNIDGRTLIKEVEEDRDA